MIHVCRGNHDITVIVHDNGVYGLTTGQVAPTAQKGFKSKSTPAGTLERPINSALTLIQEQLCCSEFCRRCTSHNLNDKGGIQHKGFSIINILQPA